MKQPGGWWLDRSRRRWLLALGVVALVTVSPLSVLSVRGLLTAGALEERGRTVCAEITNQGITRGRHTTHDLKYRFQIEGVWYQHSDETGRTDLWASVAEDAWYRSLERGCVDVVYLPDAPGVNRPVYTDRIDDPVGNKIAGLGLCALLLGLCGAAALGIVRTARTRLWRVIAADAKEWIVESNGERRKIAPDDVRRAVLVFVPDAIVSPPWRFESDVLRLRLASTDRLVLVADRDDPSIALVVSHLDARGVLKRKRAQ